MKLHEIQIPTGARRKPKRVGRGESSGYGKTAGKGAKGQNARSGGGKSGGFEGGQMPLKRRLPKRGFHNKFGVEYATINIDILNGLTGVDIITPEVLVEKRVIKDLKDGLKVLGNGSIQRSITVKASAFSASAAEKIKAAGGIAEVI